MKNKVLKGAYFLILSGLICKVLGAFFRIPLAEIIGTEGIGIYQMIMPIYSLVFLLVSGGIVVSIAKSVSAARAGGGNANGVFRAAFLYTLFVGAFFSLLFVLLSGVLARFQGNDKATLSYMAIGVAVVFTAVSTSFKGYFQGHENMVPTAVSQIIEQVIKVFAGIFLAYLLVPYGVMYGALGAVFGVMFGEVFSLVFLFITFKVKFKNVRLFKGVGREEFGSLFKISIPLMVSGLILPFCTAVDSVFVVNLLKGIGYSGEAATSLFGLSTGMITSIINFPVVIAGAIGVSLLPSLSFKLSGGDIQGAKNMVGRAFKFVWLLILPASLGLMTLSPFVLKLLFPTSLDGGLYALSVNLLCIGSISIIFMGLTHLTTGILQALGEIRAVLFSYIIGGALKITLTFVLVSLPEVNILGLQLASLVMYIAIALINLAFVEVKIGLKLKPSDIILPVIYSLIMGFIVYVFSNSVEMRVLFVALLSIMIGGIVYALFLIPWVFRLKRKRREITLSGGNYE